MQKIKASDIPCPTESQEQQTLFGFCSVELSRYPELEMLAHIPNEGKRTKSTGGRLKKEGLRKGYPDIVLNVSRQDYHGLFLELKRKRGYKVTKEQKEWIIKLNRQGNAAAFCYGWEQAWEFIYAYLTCDKSVNSENIVKFKGGGGMIDKTKIFPLLLIILDLGAAVMFVPRKDLGNIIYWLAAAILNIAVTFLM